MTNFSQANAPDQWYRGNATTTTAQLRKRLRLRQTHGVRNTKNAVAILLPEKHKDETTQPTNTKKHKNKTQQLKPQENKTK